MARGSVVKRIGKRKVKGKPAVYYYAVYYVGKKQKWEKAPYPGRKEDAERLLAQRLREVDQGEYREIQKTTFAEFAARWIRDYVEDPNHVKQSTTSTYKGIFKRRLLPFFGEYPLTAITSERVQEFTSGMSREGLAPKTIHNHLIPLGAMFNAAVRLGYLKSTPMTNVQKPKLRRREMAKALVNLKDLRKAFSDAQKAADCPKIRIHDLRHSYAALLIAQNANPKYIQRQLGHASIQTTFDIYGHLMPEVSREMVEKLDLQVFGAVS